MRRLLALIVGVAIAGCATPSDPFTDENILASFPDAKVRVANVTEGDHRFTQAITVSNTANQLVVKAIYRSTKDGSFVLKRPDGNGARFDTFPEPRTIQTEEWFRAINPPPGRWYLSGHLTHGGAYAFGVYVR